MKKVSTIFCFLIFLFCLAHASEKDYQGTAEGELEVSGKSVPLKFSYAVQKTKKLSVILSDRPIPLEALANSKMLTELSSSEKFRAIEVVIDSNKKAAEVFFYDNRLPGEMSVKEPGPFTPKKMDEKTVSGKLVMNDPGFSFGYNASFSAPVYRPEMTPGQSVNSSMTSEEQAKTGLKNAGLDFEEETFTRKIMDGDVGAVQLFLQSGMPPVSRGKSAVWMAIEFKHPDVVKALIDAGANITETDESGTSMVMKACDTKDIQIVELLIQAGADVNKPNEYKIAPLASASEQGSKEIVQLLLKSGAKVNARNPYGGTALQVAVLRGYADIVKMLIDAGADVERDRKELLEIAQREKHPDVEKLIREAPAKKKEVQ
jgi:hypothetical protein